jgi:hypothetical protein
MTIIQYLVGGEFIVAVLNCTTEMYEPVPATVYRKVLSVF